jgi:hypothetical protein
MKYLLTILALFATSAFALDINDHSNRNNQTQGQLQGQAQAQLQGQAQGQIANADSRSRALSFASANNSQSLTTAPVTVSYNEAEIPASTRNEQVGTVNVRTVPNVFAGNVYPTTNCAHSATAGVAALGWGASFGSSFLDKECSLRETARSFSGMGMTADAVAILCSSEYASAAPTCKAIADSNARPEPK